MKEKQTLGSKTKWNDLRLVVEQWLKGFLRFDTAQPLTPAEQAQAQANLGISGGGGWNDEAQSNGVNATVMSNAGGYEMITGGASNPVDRYMVEKLNGQLQRTTFSCRVNPTFPKLIIETDLASASSARLWFRVESVGDINGTSQATVDFSGSVTYHANVATAPVVDINQHGAWLDGTIHVTKRASKLVIVVEFASLQANTALWVSLLTAGCDPYAWSVTQSAAFPVWWGTQPSPITTIPFTQSNNSFGNISVAGTQTVGGSSAVGGALTVGGSGSFGGGVTATSFNVVSDGKTKRNPKKLDVSVARMVMGAEVGTFLTESGEVSAGVLDARALREQLPEDERALFPIITRPDKEGLAKWEKRSAEMRAEKAKRWAVRVNEVGDFDDPEAYEKESAEVEETIAKMRGDVPEVEIVTMNIGVQFAAMQAVLQEQAEQIAELMKAQTKKK